MKKNIYILLALLLGLSLTTCKKDAVPDKLTVNAEVKEVTTNSVIIEGSYEYSMEITEFEMFYSTTDDMNGSQSVKITPEGNDFSVELTGLEDNSQYYFNFVFTGNRSGYISRYRATRLSKSRSPSGSRQPFSRIPSTIAGSCSGGRQPS